VDAFVDVLRKSQLVDAPRLDSYWQNLRQASSPPDLPHRLARRMVEDGLLTNFQAEQLLKGKSKGYELGNYRILERIGRGGMGTVYLAEHRRMHHRVAIKVLPPDHAANPTLLERFYREARSAGHLSHPNLVRAHDVDEEKGVHYLVMEYVEGVTLHDLVTRRGPVSIERAAHYIGQAAVGLQYAHEAAGLVHRDVKPGNLLVDRSGTVRILDMGLARLAQAAFFDENADSITRRFNDRSVLGTADYIAPEQAVNSQSADTRADVYSLGGTFYFLLTGQPPFPTGSVSQKLIWHQMREPTPVRQLRSEVPERIAELIRRMMSKKPDQRPQTPGEVVDALLPWIEMQIPPPAEDEVPRMCLAAQGPSSGGSSPSSINLGALAARASRAGAETPAGMSSGSMTDSQSSRITRPTLPPGTQPVEVPPSLRNARRIQTWLIAAAAGILAGAVTAVCLWHAIGR